VFHYGVKNQHIPDICHRQFLHAVTAAKSTSSPSDWYAAVGLGTVPSKKLKGSKRSNQNIDGLP
jgi:hypothetical protein